MVEWRILAIGYWLLAIGYCFRLFAKHALLVQNKLNPAPDFIVPLVTFSPAQVLVELTGIFVRGLAF
jgi:hypothetical protein